MSYQSGFTCCCCICGKNILQEITTHKWVCNNCFNEVIKKVKTDRKNLVEMIEFVEYTLPITNATTTETTMTAKTSNYNNYQYNSDKTAIFRYKGKVEFAKKDMLEDLADAVVKKALKEAEFKSAKKMVREYIKTMDKDELSYIMEEIKFFPNLFESMIKHRLGHFLDRDLKMIVLLNRPGKQSVSSNLYETRMLDEITSISFKYKKDAVSDSQIITAICLILSVQTSDELFSKFKAFVLKDNDILSKTESELFGWKTISLVES